jgi:hypothetical protein
VKTNSDAHPRTVTGGRLVRNGFALLAFTLTVNVAHAGEKQAKREPKIILSPAELTFETPSEPNGFGKFQPVHFTLTNLTGTTQRFCRFYACWSPIIVQKDGGVLHVARRARDATRVADSSIYPLVGPGKSIDTKPSWGLRNSDAGALLSFNDFTGTMWSYGPMAPGDYKACLSYRFDVARDPIVIGWGLEALHLKPAQIYSGWVMSNWIHIKVLAPSEQKDQPAPAE